MDVKDNVDLTPEAFDWEAFEGGNTSSDKNTCSRRGNDVVIGRLLKGELIQRGFVDLKLGDNLKGEFPIEEIRYDPSLKIGDSLDVKVIETENIHGNVGVSHKEARIQRFEEFEPLFLRGDIINARIKYALDDYGYLVDINGETALLPYSQVVLNFDSSSRETLIGQTVNVKIVSLEKDIPLMVVSQQSEVLEANYAEEANGYWERYINVGFVNSDDCDDEDDNDEIDERYERAINNPPSRSSMRFTGGYIRPCPYCGSNSIETFFDGTALCCSCYKWYRYS